MKYLIILLSLFATSAHAWDDPLYTPPGMRDSYDGGAMWRNHVYETRKPQITHSRRNIFGGEDFYGNRGFMGSSRPNVFGGRDFYKNY